MIVGALEAFLCHLPRHRSSENGHDDVHARENDHVTRIESRFRVRHICLDRRSQCDGISADVGSCDIDGSMQAMMLANDLLA